MLDEIADDQYRSDVRELQAFLYILLRDHLPSGTVHEILKNHTSKGNATWETVYSNQFLAAESRVLAEAILGHTTFMEVMTKYDNEISPIELTANTESVFNDPRDW